MFIRINSLITNGYSSLKTHQLKKRTRNKSLVNRSGIFQGIQDLKNVTDEEVYK